MKIVLKIICFAVILGIVGATSCTDAEELAKHAELVNRNFQVRGLGGAGGMYNPAVCDFDPDFMLICCDMSGSYRSIDGGKTWELIHFKQMNNNRSAAWPTFFRDRVFWNRGGDLRVSRDQGETWQSTGSSPWDNGEIFWLEAVSGTPDVLLVATKNGLFRTEDDGQSWHRTIAAETRCALAIGSKIYAISEANRLSISTDGGRTWNTSTVQVTQGQKIIGFTGGQDEHGTVLVASAEETGVLRSTNEGRSWEIVIDQYEDQRILQMARNQTRIVYMAQSGSGRCKNMWVSRDGGKTWRKGFRMGGRDGNVKPSWVQTQLKWGYYITRHGFYASKSDPNLALISTQGDFYLTRDGGQTWQQQMNEILGVQQGDPAVRFRCTGLEVTSCWGYLFDPFDRNREYIAYTDIGCGRTVDNGRTWSWAAKGSPWSNTFYDVVFDPAIKGKMFAAAANRHDIPHWTHITPNDPKIRSHRGGFVISEDHAISWTSSTQGLPNLPCTSVCLDPNSPQRRRTLYVTVFGAGVYKSTDGGRSWVRKSVGLGNPGNMHAYRVRRHPLTGNLYCLITARRVGARDFPVPGGVWRSTNGGESWIDITKRLGLVWPTSLAVDADNESTLYITAATAPGKEQGGVYKTTNGGQTWRHILTDKMLYEQAKGSGFDHVMSVLIHPDDKDLVYVGTTSHGLWYSQDAGTTWSWYKEFPFQNVQSIQLHPEDHDTLYLTTFGGGAWVGPHLPSH